MTKDKKPKLDTMTVGELRELLGQFPQDQPIATVYPSHDHWRTRLIGVICEEPEVHKVRYTEYHQCFELIDPDNEEANANPDAIEVVILGRP